MIKNKITHLGISLTYIAEKSEISRPTLYKFLNYFDRKYFNKITPKALLIFKLIDEEMKYTMDWIEIHEYASPGELDGMLHYYDTVAEPKIRKIKDKILHEIKKISDENDELKKNEMLIANLSNITYSGDSEATKLLQEINILLIKMDLKDLEVIKDQIQIYQILQSRKR